jgi:chlorophyllide a reductase subunit Z
VVNVIRDIPETSSYWGLVWTFCTLPDVHVICDAPLGCFNLVATAVSDYTDAIPHIENITPSVIREKEVGGSGTGPAVQRTYEGLRDMGKLVGKHLIVLSTAESEMIGSDLSDLVKTFGPDAKFYYSNSLTDDEWVGRDQGLKWLWQSYGAAQSQAQRIQPEPGLVNIIGPTYGCFNSPADLHEVKRLIEGAGGRVNLVYPMQASLARTPELAKAQVNVLMYQEFGHSLADEMGKPRLYAPFGIRQTTEFVRSLGKLLGTEAQAEAFVRAEKKGTLQAVWDLWRGPQGDWFPTTTVGIVASRTYVEGLSAFLGGEMGMPIAFTAARPQQVGEMNNHDVRKRIHTSAPAFLFGSINERIYLSEAGARMTNYIQAAFPGPVVRRALGTPFMGYSGTVYLLQEIVNRLYDTLFNFLPVDGAYSKNPGAPKMARDGRGNLPWDPAAKELLDMTLEKMPFMSRISASRELQMQVEGLARSQELSTITTDLVEQALSANGK